MNTAHTKDILLPEKPSELIMLALKDLVTVRDLPGYAIDMGFFHCPANDITYVNLVGAVIANTLKLPKNSEANPSYFRPNGYIVDRLIALTFFSIGAVRLGCWEMYVKDVLDNRAIPKYRDNPEGFLMAMTDLANDLALKGL